MKKALVLAGLFAGLLVFASSGTAEAGHRYCPGSGGFRGASYGYGYGDRGFRGRSFHGSRYGHGFRSRGYGFRGPGYRRGFNRGFRPYGRNGFNVRTRGFYLGIGR